MTGRRPLLALAASAMSAMLAACVGTTACTTEPRPAVIADIRDAASGQGAAYNASLIVENASVYDSVPFAEFIVDVQPGTDTTIFATIHSRRAEWGSFTVRVRRAGYVPWERRDVEVARDRCGPRAALVEVRLQRAG